MSHPDNEPGKSYDINERRQAAALAACEGLPTEWLERDLVQELYKFVAMISLADHMATEKNGYVQTPSEWWAQNVRGGIDRLNEIAQPGFIPKPH